MHSLEENYVPNLMILRHLTEERWVSSKDGMLCKHNQSVDIGEKLVYTRFELLKKAY